MKTVFVMNKKELTKEDFRIVAEILDKEYDKIK